MATLLMNCLSTIAKRALLLHEFVKCPTTFTPSSRPPPKSAGKSDAIHQRWLLVSRAKRANVNTAIGSRFHRPFVRDLQDYEHHRSYITKSRESRTSRGATKLFPYSSAFPGIATDPAPPWLKPAAPVLLRAPKRRSLTKAQGFHHFTAGSAFRPLRPIIPKHLSNRWPSYRMVQAPRPRDCESGISVQSKDEPRLVGQPALSSRRYEGSRLYLFS